MNVVNLLTSDDQNWNSRYKRNCAVFIISYIFMGAVTGITNDTYVSYLNMTVPDVVKAFPMWGSISSLAMALIILAVPKIGYKKMIVISPLLLIAALLACIYSRNTDMIIIANLLVNIGAGMFDFMYPLMFTSYVPKDKRVSMFARVMYCNLISQAILTFLNGKIVVWQFAQYLGISYDQASNMSEHPQLLNALQNGYYLNSYELAMWIAIIFTVLSFLAVLFLKEVPADYHEETNQPTNKFHIDWSILKNKYALLWVLIWAPVRFGASIVLPYFPIYLNNFLHISRGATSTIITMQTFAMVLGYFATPYIEKKMGSIVSTAVLTIACVPMMLIMANGLMFGSNIAWIIGIVLFLRSGLANATSPINASLPLTFVSKNLVPAYSSFMTIFNSAIGILAGLYCRYWLLRTDAGYGYAYYITSTLYVIAMILLVIVFAKKYNRTTPNENELTMNETKEAIRDDAD